MVVVILIVCFVVFCVFVLFCFVLFDVAVKSRRFEKGVWDVHIYQVKKKMFINIWEHQVSISTNCNHRTINKHPKTKSNITSSLSTRLELEFSWKQSTISHQVQLHTQKQIPKNNNTPRWFWYDDIVLFQSLASTDISLWVSKWCTLLVHHQRISLERPLSPTKNKITTHTRHTQIH